GQGGPVVTQRLEGGGALVRGSHRRSVCSPRDRSRHPDARGMKPPAVVLGGTGAALSVTRSLSRHGVRVHVLGDSDSIVAGSRHWAEQGDGGPEAGARAGGWGGGGGAPGGAVVRRGGDEGVELSGRTRARLEEWGYVPVEADDEVMLAMLDKQRTR